MSDEYKTELSSEQAKNIEYVGISDDSGFASISGSVGATETQVLKEDEPLNKIADDVKINNAPFDVEDILLVDRKRKRSEWAEAAAEKKRLATEEYNRNIREQRYKRLMHLLDRSQFYSKYLVNKIDESLQTEKKKPTDKRKNVVVDENSPPKKKNRRVKKEKQDYDIRDYVSVKDVEDKVEKSKLNLSQEEIAGELLNGVDEPEEKPTPEDLQPIILKYFVGSLRAYQVEGLKWLKVLYENGVNGILADEMGLGKTIQVIALICYLIEKKIPGPYLIIAPLSTIPNWLMEWENFAPQIPVVLLHGPPAERQKMYRKIRQTYNVDANKTQPVVLTTFEIPLVESHFLQRQRWRYIIIDEGHRIKNHECQLLQVLKDCQSVNRLLLTGTPLQNNLAELWSLLNFLLPEIFNDLAVFESWFDAKELENDAGTQRILQQEAEKQVLSSLRGILKPFMLRRLKTDVCLEIPPKKEIVVYAPLTELQHSLYKAVLSRDIRTMSKIEEEDLIIPDVDGKRPQRKCRMKKDVNYYNADDMSDRSSSRASTPTDDEDIGVWTEDVKVEDGALAMWKKFADVNDRNREFLIRITFRSRTTMYKKIVNHPYLVHCPLDDAGLPKIDENLIKSSGKLLVLDAMLEKLQARGHKILLFSTMTTILDMIEDYLEMRDYEYARLDGSRKIEDRKENIKRFNSDPNVLLFLISTRAGGVGLNLTAADTVIIYDSDWNPQADIQAMARCHRIGQTKPVVIYKFCTKGTIDERIISRAQAKRKLEKMVISDVSMKLTMNIDALRELQKLLESSENHIVTAESNVFTHQELDELLDRSDLMPKKEAAAENEESTNSVKPGGGSNQE